ncbi:MAG: hypothetical protein K2G68_04030 [Helicobacter sp.]|nr:hypothetical protein [Helicobacter sp.]
MLYEASAPPPTFTLKSQRSKVSGDIVVYDISGLIFLILYPANLSNNFHR